ncbi:hypothetical protein TWF694_010751 [Orbilia ellipsospora]|uniref:Uncharacterized protein n=1 Tax=Orbilia ellipsospora TaxID=2528407 RepID=A0AAV9X6Y7_9PEZI
MLPGFPVTFIISFLLAVSSQILVTQARVPNLSISPTSSYDIQRRDGLPKLSTSESDFKLYGGDISTPRDTEADPDWLTRGTKLKTDSPDSSLSQAFQVAANKGAYLYNAVFDAYNKNWEQIYEVFKQIDPKNNYEWEGALRTFYERGYVESEYISDGDGKFAALRQLYNFVSGGFELQGSYSEVLVQNVNGALQPPYRHFASLSDNMLIIEAVRKYEDESKQKMYWSDVVYSVWLQYTDALDMKDAGLGLNYISIVNIEDLDTIEVILQVYKSAGLDPRAGDKGSPVIDRLPKTYLGFPKYNKENNSKLLNSFCALLGTPLAKGITRFLVEHRDNMNHLEVDYINVMYNTPTQKFTMLMRLNKG